MTKSLAAWLFGIGLFTVLSLRHPVYGLLAYMQTFFFAPAYWWWGKPVADHGWALITGFVALFAGLLYALRQPWSTVAHSHFLVQTANILMIMLWLNATVVHLVLAPVAEISAPAYWELTRFVVLVFVFQMCVKSLRDLEWLLLFILIGLAYIGYEVTINDRGSIIGNRLEGVGVPGGSEANHLSSLIVTFLPLVGVFFITGRWWERAVAVFSGPLMLNVLLLCNSRGAFLGAIVMLVMFLLCCPRRHRKKAMVTLACGVLALYLLLGDQRIVQRFMTVFRSGEERDQSAQGRLHYWQAGLKMIADHPFGRGGYAFKIVYGPQYIAESFDERFDSRSVHQGFINDACEWGIQGLALRVAVFVIALQLLRRQIKTRWRAPSTRVDPAIIAAALYAGTLGFLTTCCFTSILDNEWGYWVVALALVIERVGSPAAEQEKHSIHVQQFSHGLPHYGYLPFGTSS